MSDGVEIGKVYTGKVKKIMEYGAFVIFFLVKMV